MCRSKINATACYEQYTREEKENLEYRQGDGMMRYSQATCPRTSPRCEHQFELVVQNTIGQPGSSMLLVPRTNSFLIH